MLALVLVHGVAALTPSVTRQAIEFGEDILLVRDPGEPPLPASAVKTCTVNRERGFSLNTPGFADGMSGVNFVKTPASWLNDSAVVCHLGRATNATGRPLASPAITAGISTVVVDMGGSPCDIALHRWCGSLFQKGPVCWTCARQTHGHQTKGAGCDKGAYKAYCGPQHQSEVSAVVLDAHRELARKGLGLSGKGPCKSGNYTCATIEHYAAFAPAFGRRPFVRETKLSLVVQTDYSLAGKKLTLSTEIAGQKLSGEIVGGGYAKLEFPMPTLPSVNYSRTVNITLTLPDGRTRSKPRRFMHAAPPKPGMPTSTVQVDHESGGLLMDGVRKTCNGWFNNPDGGIAGLPASETCDVRRTDSLREQTLLAAKNQAAQVANQGMKGITFLRDSIPVECEKFDPGCFGTPAYERDWANRMHWLDAAAVAGVHVLMYVGVDHLSSCRSGWIDKVRRPQNVHALTHNGSCFVDGVPQPATITSYEAWVFDAVKRLRDHPAVAGYYGCDDCCHTVRGTYCGLEYRGIAKIREEIFALDPYHPTFGTSACGEVWMWQEEGFGLGLDVVMKEGYAGLIGASTPTFKGTPKTMKAYPMALEPLWACGDDASSPQALRSTVYGKALTQGTDNSFYVGTDRTANGRNWQIMAATETVSTELQSLTGAVRSRAHFENGYVQPTAECTHGVVIPSPEYKPEPNGTFGNLVSARVFGEEQPAGMNASAAAAYFCYSLIAVNAKPFPFLATLRIDRLSLPVAVLPAAGTTTKLPFTRLFRGTCKALPCTKMDLNSTLYPNGSAVLTDVFDVESTNVYRLGCQLELLRMVSVPGELCAGGAAKGAAKGAARDCDFELGDLSRGLFMPAWAETMMLEFNRTDDRQYVSLDSAYPYHGRHSARINAPNADVLLMAVQTASDGEFKAGGGAGRYRVSFAARSSPAGATAGAIFEQYAPLGPKLTGPPKLSSLSASGTTLSTEWIIVEQIVEVQPVNCTSASSNPDVHSVSCAKVPLQIWARSPFETGALIGIDDISVVKM